MNSKKNTNKKPEKQSGKNNAGFALLQRYASKRAGTYIVSVVLAILGVACSMAPYYGVYRIIVLIMDGNNRSFAPYLPWVVFCAAALFLWVVFHNISTSLSHKATFATLSDVRMAISEKLVKIPMGYTLSKPSGELKASLVEKTESMEPMLAHALPELTSNLLVPLCIFVYIFLLDWRMGLLALLTLPIGMLCMKGMMKDYEKNFQEYTNVGKRMNAAAVEYINGIEVIKAFGRSASSYEKFKTAVKDNASYGINWMKDVQKYYALAFGVWPSILIAILPAGVFFLMSGSLPQEEFILIILLSTGIFAPIVAALSFVDGLAQTNISLGDLAEIDNYPPMNRPDKEAVFGERGSDISLSGVKFSYGEKEILHGIDAQFKQNEVTALVGPSGGGKSTIAKLIAGFWDWPEGEISIGGVNAKDIPLDQLNRKIAYVSQDNFLFDESIMENIRMGRPDASDDDVIASAKAAGCHDFIMSLEDGYDTMAGSAGGHLSGGERQRIAIARAMLKDGDIVILDEATAYTDPENEAIMQEAVSRLVQGKTLIVIAHRLSTITDSDRIIVIDGGEVSACGKHDELLEKSELYKKMWTAHISSKDKSEVA